MSKEDFLKTLEAKTETASSAPEEPVKRKRGRPFGSTKTKTEGTTTENSEEQPIKQDNKPIPPVNEMEAVLLAAAATAISNMMVKKEHRDKLYFTNEEWLSITRPLIQLKDYYFPNMGGIYVVWAQLALAGSAVGLSKYTIMKEIMENVKPAEGSQDNLNNGDKGDGQVHQVTGDNTSSPEGSGV